MKLKKLPKINCDAVREVWDDRKSLNDNLTSMGLMADPNQHKQFRIPSGKQQMMPKTIETELEVDGILSPNGNNVVDKLASEAKKGYEDKKAIAHPLPPEMLKKVTKLLDKHGEDFEAMSRDHTNYYQETPAQLRAQVIRLKKIPQQWIPYLKSRDLFEKVDSTSK